MNELALKRAIGRALKRYQPRRGEDPADVAASVTEVWRQREAIDRGLALSRALTRTFDKGERHPTRPELRFVAAFEAHRLALAETERLRLGRCNRFTKRVRARRGRS